MCVALAAQSTLPLVPVLGLPWQLGLKSKNHTCWQFQVTNIAPGVGAAVSTGGYKSRILDLYRACLAACWHDLHGCCCAIQGHAHIKHKPMLSHTTADSPTSCV